MNCDWSFVFTLMNSVNSEKIELSNDIDKLIGAVSRCIEFVELKLKLCRERVTSVDEAL